MIQPGTKVYHADFGPGVVKAVLGQQAIVTFSGEEIAAELSSLDLIKEALPHVDRLEEAANGGSIDFRRAFEALNLGVIPPTSTLLIDLTIRASALERQVSAWLDSASSKGACKTFFGRYGSGKSHHLKLVRAIALKRGWVTAWAELDPKGADPAKPHLLYRALLSGLLFPPRVDGSHSTSFMDLVKEIRTGWEAVCDGPYFSRSPWFAAAFTALRHFPHSEEQEYRDAVGWLDGQTNALSSVKKLLTTSGRRDVALPRMPRSREHADVYGYHLVVLHEVCKRLGYRGLALFLDEAEHVRSLNVKRRERANNFLDILARSAHPALKGEPPPAPNEWGFPVPRYWQEGPHFALFVGLTDDGSTIDPSVPLRDSCVFLHSEEDRIDLKSPSAADYGAWCERFYLAAVESLPIDLALLARPEHRRDLVDLLARAFEVCRPDERVLRHWTKLAALAPAILMSRRIGEFSELAYLMREATQNVSTRAIPWEA